IRMAQKIGDGCPFSQGKQILSCNPCPFHSIHSQENLVIANLPSTVFVGNSIEISNIESSNSHSITSTQLLNIIPLRC
ncbi:MAG: hypothetical protein ACPL6D_15390, partial [Thermodesulfobacteriota bacterium]